METKREIEVRAKALIESSPDEAVSLYHKAWLEYRDEFSSWDAFVTIKTLRSKSNPDLSWATEIAEKYEDEKVRGIYGWLIYDSCIKKRERDEILQAENRIKKLCDLVSQKNLRENDAYPCPVTISVFKLVDAFAENQFNARKVHDWLDKLNPSYLSEKTRTISTEERGDVEIASDFEKYYSFKTKALLKLELYEDCKSLCQYALDKLAKFHYDNDLWLRMRIAIAEEKLGHTAESESLFKKLISTKAGSDKWFLYKEIAELYYEHNNFDKAWKYAVDSSFFGNEPHFMIGLFLLQARILYKLERPIEGKVLAQLICAILKEQKWKNKPEYETLLRYYKINEEQIAPTHVYLKEAQQFWVAERYRDVVSTTGEVIFVHANGKVGKIKDVNGNSIHFHRKNIVQKQKRLEELKGATVEFMIMKSYDGSSVAENISVIKSAEQAPPELVGKRLKGTIKNVVEFGLFVRLNGHPDGLLHKSMLPGSLKNSFQKGDAISVEVLEVSDKGIRLKLAES